MGRYYRPPWIKLLNTVLQGCQCHVTNLDLLDGQIQKGILVTDTNQALGPFAAHAGSQTSIQLHNHQLIQTVRYVVWYTLHLNLIVWLDLKQRQERETTVSQGIQSCSKV